MLADGQTDMMKLIIDFRNFANAPKNYASFKCVIQRNYQLVRLHSVGDRTNKQRRWKDTDGGKSRYSEKTLSRCNIVPHISQE
jgi:hypothetical protein